jgi:hypothetical protein
MMSSRPVEVRYTQAYLRRKQALVNDEVRRSLELAEEAIAVDPDHRLRRLERRDGNVTDLNEPGLLVSFRILDDQSIELVEFMDLWDR